MKKAFTSNQTKLYFLALDRRRVNLFHHPCYIKYYHLIGSRNPMSPGIIICFAMALLLAVPHFAGAEKIVLTAVGDIMLAGSGVATFAKKGYEYPFVATGLELRRSDIAIGNLEAPLARRGTEFTGKKFRFKASPKAAAALRTAGFSVVTLANNHIMDFGLVGLQETMENLASEKIVFAGAGENLAAARRPALVERKGKKIAFLAYSLTQPLEFFADGNRAGTAPGYARLFREDIRQAKYIADYVVVSFHWGAELASFPKSYQVDAGRRAIDAGADLVIGHHPHVLQGVERYRRGLILYSLGNFAFGSMSRQADTSILARITLDGTVREAELIPLNVLNTQVRFQPGILKGTRGRAVISRLNELSRSWNTEIVSEGERYLVKLDPADHRPVVR
jgi:poly-gamma-glutamate synthesis protein (capsule biosynthesis protein)